MPPKVWRRFYKPRYEALFAPIRKAGKRIFFHCCGQIGDILEDFAELGVDALILAFVVVVIGGLGSLEGALVGALIVGVIRTLGINFFPEIELAVLYLIAAVVLLVRPAGLFGRP